MSKTVWKSVLIGLCVVIAALVVYYLTWTPNTKGITAKARLAVERSEDCDRPRNYHHHFPIWLYMVGAGRRGYVDYKFYRCVE